MQIVQWAELHYPSWVQPGGPAPLYRDDPAAAEITDARIQQQPLKPAHLNANGAAAVVAPPPPPPAAGNPKPDWDDAKLLMVVMSGVVILLGASAIAIMLLVWYFNKVSMFASVDVGTSSIKRHRGKLPPRSPSTCHLARNVSISEVMHCIASLFQTRRPLDGKVGSLVVKGGCGRRSLVVCFGEGLHASHDTQQVPCRGIERSALKLAVSKGRSTHFPLVLRARSRSSLGESARRADMGMCK